MLLPAVHTWRSAGAQIYVERCYKHLAARRPVVTKQHTVTTTLRSFSGRHDFAEDWRFRLWNQSGDLFYDLASRVGNRDTDCSSTHA